MTNEDFIRFASEKSTAITPMQKALDLMQFFQLTYRFLYDRGRIEKHKHYAEAIDMMMDAVTNSNWDENEMSLVYTAYDEGYRRGWQHLSNEVIDHWNDYMTGEGPTLTPEPELKNVNDFFK